VLISKSGATEELLRLIPALRRAESPLIGVIGNRNSPLAKEVDVLLDASVNGEASPDHSVPTASTLVAMALGDAFAVALISPVQKPEPDPVDDVPGEPGILGRGEPVGKRHTRILTNWSYGLFFAILWRTH
jgi:arabinose-5-phosphate isomerase